MAGAVFVTTDNVWTCGSHALDPILERICTGYPASFRTELDAIFRPLEEGFEFVVLDQLAPDAFTRFVDVCATQLDRLNADQALAHRDRDFLARPWESLLATLREDPRVRSHIDPDLWQIPTWHPDWDGDFMFEGLRMIGKAVLAATDLDAKLAVIDEGSAHVDVFHGRTRIGFVHVNRGDCPTVPEFSVYAGADADELTTTDITAAVRFLDEHRTAFPEDPE